MDWEKVISSLTAETQRTIAEAKRTTGSYADSMVAAATVISAIAHALDNGMRDARAKEAHDRMERRMAEHKAREAGR